MIAPLARSPSRSSRKVRRSRRRPEGRAAGVAVFLRIPKTERVEPVPAWKVRLLVGWIVLVIAVTLVRVFLGMLE